VDASCILDGLLLLVEVTLGNRDAEAFAVGVDSLLEGEESVYEDGCCCSAATREEGNEEDNSSDSPLSYLDTNIAISSPAAHSLVMRRVFILLLKVTQTDSFLS